MKQQITQLFDQLADKSLTRGCVVKERDSRERKTRPRTALFILETSIQFAEVGRTNAQVLTNGLLEHWSIHERTHEILGHPILIGDVLEKMHTGALILNPEAERLLVLWAGCGFTRSLQEIFDCEWISEPIKCACERNISGRKICECPNHLVPKDPSICALGEFLLQIFNPVTKTV